MVKDNYIRLNLGCGTKKLDGFINCDMDPKVKPDRLIDLSKKLPFKTNTVDEIYCSHTLEHIDKKILVNTTLPEMWRICKPNARVTIIVPYMDAQNLLNHEIRFNEDTFSNWCKETYSSTDTFPFRFSFELINFELSIPKYWWWLFYLIPLKTWKRLWQSLIHEIQVEMGVKKLKM